MKNKSSDVIREKEIGILLSSRDKYADIAKKHGYMKDNMMYFEPEIYDAGAQIVESLPFNPNLWVYDENGNPTGFRERMLIDQCIAAGIEAATEWHSNKNNLGEYTKKVTSEKSANDFSDTFVKHHISAGFINEILDEHRKEVSEIEKIVKCKKDLISNWLQPEFDLGVSIALDSFDVE